MLKIPIDAKILSVSHNDLDGVGCQIVLGNVYKNITYTNSAFYNIDQNLKSINYNNYDYVYITDIHPDDGLCLDLSEKIILIDHHPSEFHLPEKNRWVIANKDKCATSLVKHFVEKIHNIKLKNLDDFVDHVNDYDMWKLNYEKSKMLNDLMFYYYRPSNFRKNFMSGRLEFTTEENDFLKTLHEKFLKTYEELQIYDLDTINGCIVFEYDFINEIADKLLYEENYNIVIIKHPKKGRVSIRGSRDDVDIGKILDNFGWGGGHPKSAGMFVKTNNELEMKVKKIEDEIYKNCKGIRK